MIKTLLVLKNELITNITRKSFLITLVLIPLVGFIVVLIASALGRDSSGALSQLVSGPPQTNVEGYVDESGLLKVMPNWVQPGVLTAFPDQSQARQALESGKISAYYRVPPDYMTTGKVFYVRKDFNPLSGLEKADLFRSIIRFNLLSSNENLALRYEMPMQKVEQTVLETEKPQREEDNPLTFVLPYVVTMLFYVVIITSSSLMLNSVTTEKQNRVIEMLMSSVKPSQMLAGKIIALGVIGLIQTVVWSGSGLLLLRFSGSAFNLPAAFQLPTSILIWGVVFFLLGYAVYASLMAGVGALVPNLREASQATTIVILPIIVPLMLINVLINSPDSATAIVLSLFPLTSSVSMMARLAAGPVIWWQLGLAVVLLAGTAYVSIRAVAGMFRAQTLLSGQAFSMKLFFKSLIGRA